MSSRTRWDWLREPLAHDFANTVHWRGTTPVDHIADLPGLQGWLAHEPHPLPPTPEPSDATAAAIRGLRDATREAMIAVAGGREPEASDVQVINDVARRNPVTHVLAPDGRAVLEPAKAGAAPLVGVLAHAAITTLGDPAVRSRIAFCAAPGCGSLFERDRANQVWCDPHCGARARAERHLQAIAH